MKKLFLALLSMLVAALIAMGCALTAFAEEDYYGTFEEGFKLDYTKIIPTEKFFNGDFEQGFKYWQIGSKPFELKEDGGNHYIKLAATKDYESIVSTMFKVEGIQPGQVLVPIYEWKGESYFQFVLTQWEMNAERNRYVYSERIAFGASKTIKRADSEDGWNTAFSYPSAARDDGTIGVVKPKESSDPTMLFALYVQCTNIPSADVSLDNIHLGIYRSNENKIYDLDGKTVLYDITALAEAQEASIEEEVEEDEVYFDLDEEEEDENSTAETVNEDGESGLGWLLYIIIGAGVVLLAAAIIVVVIIVKKKKSTQKSEITENTDAAINENSDNADSTGNAEEERTDQTGNLE